MPDVPAASPEPRAAAAPVSSTALTALTAAGGRSVLDVHTADVGATRERQRLRRFVKITVAVWAVAGLLWARALTMGPGASFV
ncbi:MAG TPA: hypothetical protein VNU26_15040, partial [Mycobacteriales bacterium]|nr:hypothetical protein [Mycobacteriales bacterium]